MTAVANSSPLAGSRSGGLAARGAVVRWARRMFRREWRQQLLVLALLTVAVTAAIARALVARPDSVLADEPTGALDSVGAQHVIELMTDASARGQTIVMVTHDPTVAGAADRVVHMIDGRLDGVAAGSTVMS